MWYANNSKSHSEAAIIEVVKRIMNGEKKLYIVACDTGASGNDDLHIWEDIKTEEDAIDASRQAFADYLDVSIEIIKSYEESAINGWRFNVLSVDEIESILEE